MNRKLKIEKIKLEERLAQLNHFIYQVDNFISTKGEYYQYEESIQALQKMKLILNSRKEEYNTLTGRIIQIQRELEQSYDDRSIEKGVESNSSLLSVENILKDSQHDDHIKVRGNKR